MTTLWVEVHGASCSGKSTLLRVIKDALSDKQKLPPALQGRRIPLREVRKPKELSE